MSKGIKENLQPGSEEREVGEGGGVRMTALGVSREGLQEQLTPFPESKT